MTRDTVLFDINETTLDLASLRPRFQAVFGDEGVAATWFSMLLHSSTVCVITNVKTDFATLARAMLDSLAVRMGLTLCDESRNQILDGFAHLPAHGDVKPALTRLRSTGYRTVAFTNSSLSLASAQIENAGLSTSFDDIVSVENSGSFKPAANAYQFVATHLQQPLAGLRLVATHDWDTHGALTAGMQAAYIDRSGAPYHPLYRQPDIYVTTMDAVVDQIIAIDGDR